MSSTIEIFVIRRPGMLGEPELHIISDMCIKEAWLFLPHYMPSGIRIRQNGQYKTDLILPRGSFFQAITEDVKCIIDNWDEGLVVLYMYSRTMFMDVQMFMSDILISGMHSIMFGEIAYMMVPVVVGQMARVKVGER